MNKKWFLAMGLVLLVGLIAWTGSARAGGWATLSLTTLPTEVVAERPFTVEFLLLQHGQTPLFGEDLFTEVRATHPASGEKVHVEAEPGSKPGLYTAVLTLPRAGEWQWEIEAFTAVYPMPPLTVSEGAAVAANPVETEWAVAWQLILGWAAGFAAILVLLIGARQKSRPRLAGAILLGLLSLTGFGLYWQMPQAVQAENEIGSMVTVPAIAPESLGEALFVAKGCIQCHQNNNVSMAENFFPIGPDITFVKRPPEYVKAWLANPPALKAGTQMPDLPLSEAEIDTLVDFLQQE